MKIKIITLLVVIVVVIMMFFVVNQVLNEEKEFAENFNSEVDEIEDDNYVVATEKKNTTKKNIDDNNEEVDEEDNDLDVVSVGIENIDKKTFEIQMEYYLELLNLMYECSDLVVEINELLNNSNVEFWDEENRIVDFSKVKNYNNYAKEIVSKCDEILNFIDDYEWNNVFVKSLRFVKKYITRTKEYYSYSQEPRDYDEWSEIFMEYMKIFEEARGKQDLEIQVDD